MHYGYNHTIGVVVFFLFFVIGSIASCSAQTVTAGSINTPSGYSIDLQTGNLVGYDSSLKTNNGWTGSYGTPTGVFGVDGYTFSYVPETLSQTVNLGGIPVSYQNTTAVFVTGFSYGLSYRFPCGNIIGGDCTSGVQDPLSVTATYYKKDGTVDWTKTTDLAAANQAAGYTGTNPIWQNFTDSYTFAGAKTLATTGTVKLDITGYDTGFWACLNNGGTLECYGPQVKDAWLKANYSVDPCILNPAYSPSCTGFSAVIQYGQSPMFVGNYYIPTSLPHIGGGVQIHGYEYGFGYYAGDYCTNTILFWCTSSSGANGRNVSVNITNSAGTSLISDSWWVDGNYSGGSRYGRALFTESQNSLNMGYVTWNVWGGYGDNMGIYAWTRPIWTPDPCYTQPLYSPNCSNFDAEIKRLADEQNKIQKASLDSTVASVSSSTTTPTSTITTTVEDPNSTAPKVTTTTTELPPPPPPPGSSPPSPGSSPPPPGSAPPPPGTAPPPQLANTTDSTATRSSTRPEVSVSSDSTSMALALIRQNQQRETEIASKASQGAVETASVAAVTSIRQAENIAIDVAAKSTASALTQQQAGTVEVGIVQNRQEMLNVGPAPGSTSVVNLSIQQRNQNTNTGQIEQQQSTTSTSTVALVQFNAMQVNTNNQNIQQFNSLQSPQILTQQTVNTVPVYQPPQLQLESKQETRTETIVQTGAIQIQILQQPQVQNVDVQQNQTQTVAIAPVTQLDLPQAPNNFLTDKTNPINDIIGSKSNMIETEKQQTQTQQVKSNVQDNDAAAGVSIASIARTPVGFNTYMIALTDASFYTPKEIYRNQKTVDNTRALRQLASDRLHQQMVDQQYLPR